MPYVRLIQDYLTDFNLEESPVLDSRISFLKGVRMDADLPQPLQFVFSGPAGQRPGHMLDGVIPVVSREFIRAIESVGVDNFQQFNAQLVHRDDGGVYTDYVALNVIGLIDSMDMEKSTKEDLMSGGDTVPDLADFTKPVISRDQSRSLLMYREMRDPSMLIVEERVKEALMSHRPGDGWGIMAVDIEMAP